MPLMRASLMSVLIAIIGSCSSDNDTVSLNNRNEALYGQWEYGGIESNTAIDINGDGTVNIDLFNTNEIRQCLKDNLSFFSSRGTGEKNAFSINENALSCGEVPAFQNIEEDNYELLNNELLRFDNRNDMKIISFSKNRLLVEQDDFLDEQNVIITYTFIRSN